MNACVRSLQYILRSSFLLLILVFSIPRNAVSQTPVFIPAVPDVSLLNTLSKKFEKLYTEEVASVPTKNRKEFEEIYKERWDNVKEKFDKKEIYTSSPAQEYLDALTAEIVKANPLLHNNAFSCYFSRSGVPNASYIGEGVILFNMGLFKKLDNESQVIFILCHELAHFYLKHSENSINKYVLTMNSDEVQKELRNIKQSNYRKREQLDKLVKGLTFSSHRHSRDHESEADSMAIELMHNTRFDISQSLSTLALLDSIDVDTLNTGTMLGKIFNAKEYPFQKRWIAREEGLLGGHAELKEDEPIADSLKTHPDCQLRIKQVAPMINRYRTVAAIKNAVNETRFGELKTTFEYEVIEYAYELNNYSKSFFYTLSLLQLRQSDPYLVTNIGRILNGFYHAQKSHNLSKFTDLPAPYHPSNYNLLLQFIQNLYPENFASLSFHFLKSYSPALGNHTPFKSAYNTSIQITQ
ncbi:MAG: peptidase family [Segetibacter sp.]|nr:peptidase family [Segetibacter sp.]